MAGLYIAFNGDNVGATIGQSVANDDHQGLARASKNIDKAQYGLDKWARSLGGKKVIGSGDESIYLIPGDVPENIEEIRSQYKTMSGHSATVGIGSTMSEAAKALIFGKMNGKNQIVQYSPDMDAALSDEDQEEVADLENQEKPEQNDSDESKDQEQEEGQEDDHNNVDSTEVSPNADNDQADSDEEMMDQEMPTAPEEEDQAAKDERADDVAQIPLDAMADDEESEDQAPEMNMAPAKTANPTTDVYAQINQDNDNKMAPPGGDEDAEAQPNNDKLADAIYSQMNNQDDSAPSQDDPESKALKQDIATALMAFRDNQEALESAKEQNPKLYQALMIMLKSMIDMGKRLGFDAEQDAEDQDNQDNLQNEFPVNNANQPSEEDMQMAVKPAMQAPEKK